MGQYQYVPPEPFKFDTDDLEVIELPGGKLIRVDDDLPPPPPPPPGGKTHRPQTSEELHTALAVAKDGDTILLGKGKTYVGHFVAELSHAKLVHVIAEDNGQLAAGTIPRDFSAWQPNIIAPSGAPAAFTVANGCHGWLFEGIRFEEGKRVVRVGFPANVSITREQLPGRIHFIRCTILGREDGSSGSGLDLNADGVVVDQCYIGRMILGPNAESQAISCWSGWGNYHVRRSYLEAAGENILIGGTASRVTPNHVEENITIEHCIMRKLKSWIGHPNLGHVKNHFEAKRGRNCNVSGCLLDTSWGSHSGASIVATVRCEHGKNPWNVIENLLIEECEVRSSVIGLNALGRDYNSGNRGSTSNITVRNCLFRLNGGEKLNARGIQLLSGVRGVMVDRCTILCEDGVGFALDSPPQPPPPPSAPGWQPEFPIRDLAIRNSILKGGMFGRGVPMGRQALDTFCRGDEIIGNVVISDKNGWAGLAGTDDNSAVSPDSALNADFSSKIAGKGCDISRFPKW